MHPRDLSIQDFTYELPPQCIAAHPLVDRDRSRLLQFRAGVITDHHFHELAGLLPDGALLVLNDTRVVNARIEFQRSTGARIEVLCLEPADGLPVEVAFAQRGSCIWNAFVGNAKRWKEGEELVLDDRGTDPSMGEGPSGSPIRLSVRRAGAEQVVFSWEPAGLTFAAVLDRVGHVPLPPYMKRPDGPADRERYNTVFARHEGSVAAPTASLHFSPALLEDLRERGVDRAELTLHVGAGTFLPVKSERMAGHEMHGEQLRIPLSVLHRLARQQDRAPVVAVGTTSLRTLESIYWHGVRVLQGRAGRQLDVGQWEPYEQREAVLPSVSEALNAVIAALRSAGEERLVGRTRLLIAPGYTIRMADALITNFHQPESTLLLLVAAFIGRDWRRVYDHALDSGYRFLSYGDASLLWCNAGKGPP